MPYVKYGIMCNGAYVIDFENNKMLYSDLLDMVMLDIYDDKSWTWI